ncbi:MAG: Dihydroorotate dehydrogenase B (NAD(+)), electron transfer subunit [Pelotomaculum sp. PtaB.Bin013]|uniref:Sulfide/dihydroorotate dehydrogenase-like FAD/NAD-binding protein n=1 Tax=Pelotomaculum isophthalicicum JI TaxID=947010 RepID=A0A9X4H5B9_9FIRM|nr:sulfide/dihydroorotate dehydrogenase-like FAD/NAD-binding protein [Pelotomaculum isophthalicicum]MDF9407478.1 sulfide/dihydroorotate dehydrogenase-like FAD/NAD-binding protein [Pelotomaculum isophthalicicum JI]MDF9407484.1 sulfide/dihydroorotate dehydrogenase-like FAD/NAD-binding protein [Pelotomaculum isophthalicicum JI]OPX91995.1 MAG: Dihydroorotate dehydrogenase B (NAD(+)), electron transfer subunit [Pelotomaculum sp. PtaB.Bin013]
MYKILKREVLAPTLFLFDIEAPLVARKAKPGQFIILRIHDEGERIPLTIADFDREKGTITCVFQEVGKTTMELATLNEGDSVRDFVGPLGEPSHIEKLGKIVCVGGGVGVAPVHPIARALKEAGNEVIGIIGARTKELLFWEDKMRNACTELRVTTDDGSYVRQGFVTDVLKEVVEEKGDIALCVAIGPLPMMRAVCNMTKEYNIKTIVSLNSIMVDGTGMCGCCRVTVGGQTKFACVDGPEFDGHAVDFAEMARRSVIYKSQEQAAVERFNHTCSCGCGGGK